MLSRIHSKQGKIAPFRGKSQEYRSRKGAINLTFFIIPLSCSKVENQPVFKKFHTLPVSSQ